MTNLKRIFVMAAIGATFVTTLATATSNLGYRSVSLQVCNNGHLQYCGHGQYMPAGAYDKALSTLMNGRYTIVQLMKTNVPIGHYDRGAPLTEKTISKLRRALNELGVQGAREANTEFTVFKSSVDNNRRLGIKVTTGKKTAFFEVRAQSPAKTQEPLAGTTLFQNYPPIR